MFDPKKGLNGVMSHFRDFGSGYSKLDPDPDGGDVAATRRVIEARLICKQGPFLLS